MELEPVIGLEIHVQLKTKSKMFCSCANIFGDVPANSAICPICLGYPGTLPVPNKIAIEWTQRAGAALDCKLATKSKFDRKSYFYPDLPKGYQISQYDQPFCGKGKLEIVIGDVARTIGITRIHLEEDAAKNTHDEKTKSTLIDFNRAGTPLMEIVTEPDIRTPAEAKIFLKELQRIMRVLGVSDADMEKGQLRCDANISLREKGSTKLHPKTEVKNINSFRNVERALQYEIERQTKEWEQGNIPNTQSTRGFNADTGKTTGQRIKEEAADYRYFPEPDIPPFQFTDDEFTRIKRSLPELPQQMRTRFVSEYPISDQHAALLAGDRILANFFEGVVSELNQLDQDTPGINASDIKALVPLAANITMRQIRALFSTHDAAEVRITPENFAELVVLIHTGKVNKNALDQILAEMQRTGGDPDPIIAKLGLEQVSGEEDLLVFVKEAITENPDVVAKIKAGKESAIQFLMGKVMAKSRGKANPQSIIGLIKSNI